ncbi:MAG: ferritin family protein [Nitrospirae bacterium]|nr:ferritin family protein [Nitrospirota bacterium]
MNAIEIAKKMETDAISFYTEAARKTKYPAGKKMFETITVDEKRHLEMVTKLLKGLDVQIQDVHPMKNIRTVFEKMKAEMMQKVEATSDELEAFKIAMQMEKEGLDFYRTLVLQAKTEKERLLFEKLAGEEQQHYDIFSNTYNFLSDTGNWFMWDEYSIVDGGTPWA